MLQTMLADRFHLVLHRETKDHAIFALVAAKGGPKLKVSQAAAVVGGGLSGPPNGPRGKGPMPRGGMMMQVDDQGAHLKASGVTLASLAEILSRFTERPVVDMTKIDGQYDFDLVISPENLRAGRGGPGGTMMGPPLGAEGGAGRAPDMPKESGGTIQEAVERYGLKLEPRKAAMEILVVDQLDKTPVEN